jgi:hypothetical protein
MTLPRPWDLTSRFAAARMAVAAVPKAEDFPSVRHGKHTELATPIKQSRTYAAVTAEHKTHLS